MIRRRFRILVFLASDEFLLFLNKFKPHISEFSLIPLQTETSRLPLESPKRSVFHCSPCFTLQNPCDNLPSFIFPNFEKKIRSKKSRRGLHIHHSPDFCSHWRTATWIFESLFMPFAFLPNNFWTDMVLNLEAFLPQ